MFNLIISVFLITIIREMSMPFEEHSAKQTHLKVYCFPCPILYFNINVSIRHLNQRQFCAPGLPAGGVSLPGAG